MEETRWRHIRIEHDRIVSFDVVSTKQALVRQAHANTPRFAPLDSWSDIELALTPHLPSDADKLVMLTLPSLFCSTTQTTLLIRRERPSEPLSEGEFENVVSAALWKQFCRQRSAMSERLGVGEPEVVIGRATILGVKLDGHRVASPIGFAAHVLEVNIIYTALSREGLTTLERVPSIGSGYCLEAGSAGALLTGTTQAGRALYIRIGLEQTTLFSVEQGEVGYLDSVGWGTQRLTEVLSEALGVSLSTASSLWEIFEKNLLSPLMKKRLEQLLHEELHIMLKGVFSALATRDIPVAYIEAASVLPPVFFSERLIRQAGISSRVWPFVKIVRSINAHFDLPLQGVGEAQGGVLFAHAFVLRALSEYGHINHMMTRRVRWLSAPAQPRVE